MELSQPTPLKIVFAGTPQFAAIIFDALLQTRHQLLAVYTQPDRRAGRGLKPRASPVKTLARARGILLYQPQTLRDAAVQETLAGLHADIMVVAAYGLLLPKSVLAAPRLGCINVHPSLLPRWRGAAPIPWAILAGDRQTGVTIMQMTEGLDSGPVLRSARCALRADDTAQSLHDRLATLGASTLIDTLEELQAGTASAHPQDDQQASYAPRIGKEQARLDWHRSTTELERQVRALNPRPVAWTTYQGQTLRIWQACPLKTRPNACPGTVLACSPSGITVATGDGQLRLLTLQRPGGRPLSAADFLTGRRLTPGDRLGNTAPINRR